MFFPPLITVALLGPVSTVLIIIDRVHRHDLNAVTKGYITLAFGGLLSAFLYAVLWQRTLRNYAYKAWLATFEEDWDRNGKYKVWCWILGVNVRLKGVFEALLMQRHIDISSQEVNFMP